MTYGRISPAARRRVTAERGGIVCPPISRGCPLAGARANADMGAAPRQRARGAPWTRTTHRPRQVEQPPREVPRVSNGADGARELPNAALVGVARRKPEVSAEQPRDAAVHERCRPPGGHRERDAGGVLA